MFTKLVYLKDTNSSSRCKPQDIFKVPKKPRGGGGVLRTTILKLCSSILNCYKVLSTIFGSISKYFVTFYFPIVMNY